jgi:hypothetical protein
MVSVYCHLLTRGRASRTLTIDGVEEVGLPVVDTVAVVADRGDTT